MSKLGFAVAVIGCLVIAGSGVLAQDAKPARREKLRKAAEIAAGVAVEKVQNGVLVNQAHGEMLSGRVAMLQGKPGTETTEINQGGLLVVRVPDSGSRPPKDIKVEAGRQFLRLGQLQGVTEKKGQANSGGGHTWILLKPVSEGEGSILVSFTPNDGGDAVEREYKVNVTAEKD